MKDELRLNGNYAGDSAWREWFALCAVGRCSGERGERLRTQVSSAMFAQLARYGFTRKDACGDDPVAAFDAYFKLKGARDEKKPLKLYFANRIKVEGLRMIDFVCGTLFGAISGRIHDIVIDWIATLKGWKPRSVRGTYSARMPPSAKAAGQDSAKIIKIAAKATEMRLISPCLR